MSFKIDHTVDVQAPADVVWEVLTDFARYGEWNPFVVECQTALKPGAPIEMAVALKNKPQHVVEVIREVSPGRGFSYSMKPVPGGALSSLRSHAIEPAGAGRSRYISHFELRGWLRHLVLALFRKNLEEGFAGMAAAIKRRAEQLQAQRQGKPARAAAH